MDTNKIIKSLPYSKPFLFVDKLKTVNENSATGTFYFSPELDFYRGHFKEKSVTPGVILTECMAQIGLVSLGIFLIRGTKASENESGIVMTSSEVEFLKPVYPGETVTVVSKKIYFRFGKLKCMVEMFDSANNIVCKGILAGMIIKN